MIDTALVCVTLSEINQNRAGCRNARSLPTLLAESQNSTAHVVFILRQLGYQSDRHTKRTHAQANAQIKTHMRIYQYLQVLALPLSSRPVPSRPVPSRPVPSRPVPSPVPSRPVPSRPPSRPVPSRPVPSRPVPSRPVPSLPARSRARIYSRFTLLVKAKA